MLSVCWLSWGVPVNAGPCPPRHLESRIAPSWRLPCPGLRGGTGDAGCGVMWSVICFAGTGEVGSGQNDQILSILELSIPFHFTFVTNAYSVPYLFHVRLRLSNSHFNP